MEMKHCPLFVQLAGGLGNQLFIWQYAHFLDESSRRRIYLLDYYSKGDLRKCELYAISVNCHHRIKILRPHKLLNPFKIYDFFKSKSKNSLIARFLFRLTYNCDSSHDIPTAYQLERKLLVRGYFQDSSTVWANLTVTKSEILKHLDEINFDEDTKNNDNRIQILHVRRGDYKRNSTTLGVLEDSYFTDNLNLNLPYIIHTDENAEQKSTLFKNALRIYGEDSSPWLVLAHGSEANIFIGSNSTLSWWAAALNKIEDAIIKLPSPWYFSSSYSEEAMHLAKAKYVKAHFRETNK